MTQEIARCLNMVRVAVARRNGSDGTGSAADRPQLACASRQLP